MTKEIDVRTHERSQFVEITREVSRAVEELGLVDGTCTVFTVHTTAGVTINENADPSVVRDMLSHLDKLVPKNDGFTHGEGNSDSHIKATLVGSSVTVPVSNGTLILGTWQGIYFCEFDGPRSRHCVVSAVGSSA